MNCTCLEKTAESTGSAIGRAAVKTFQTIGKHPKTTLGIVGALAGLGMVTRYANQVRGLHQILNANHQSNLMNEQVDLLNRIANEDQRPPESPVATVNIPLTPPLR